ncbi:MAG: hypothetical protein QM765_16585 [Myxococcales bacterium]
MPRACIHFVALGFLILALAASDRARPGAAVFRAPRDSVKLEIADRQWAPGAPLEGWCGEASIQMAALYYGAWIPQAVINRAGRPKTPDLWETDVSAAMQALGLRFEAWSGGSNPSEALDWTVRALRRGHPVILGVKVYPTEHADWDVDHLVLAVGFEPKGLVLNTNWGDRQLTWPWVALQEAKHGYSLAGPKGKVFAWEVTGFEEEEGALRTGSRSLARTRPASTSTCAAAASPLARPIGLGV